MRELLENHDNKNEEFESLKEPEELLGFMNDKIAYGYVGTNGEIHAPEDSNWDAEFQKEYSLQSPDELLASGHGVCWDTVELERKWFTDHGFSPETYFMMYVKEGGTDLPTHTFLVYEKDSKWYWFEHSFGDHRGLHAYDSREELIDDVKKKHHEYAVQHRGATDIDFAQLRITAYDQPTYGARPQEFVNDIIESIDK